MDENMVYLLCKNDTKHVVKISETPIAQEQGYFCAKSDSYKVGDEFTYYILVHETDENGVVISSASVRQAPQATYILQENAILKEQIDQLTIMLGDALLEGGI